MSKERRYINGEQYKLCVFLVTKTFPNGTPRVLERIPELGSVRLKGGEWFIHGYVREDVMTQTPSFSPFGRCPTCGCNGVSRERRPDGNDECVNGHVYKSSEAIQ